MHWYIYIQKKKKKKTSGKIDHIFNEKKKNINVFIFFLKIHHQYSMQQSLVK